MCMNYRESGNQGLIKYRGILSLGGLFFYLGLAIFFAVDFAWLHLAITITGLIGGRLMLHYFESVITDKIRTICLAILPPSFFIFMIIVILFWNNIDTILVYTDMLLPVQLILFSLFLGLSFEELSKNKSKRLNDKIKLKIDELKEERVEGLEEVLAELDEVEKTEFYSKLMDLPIKSHRKKNRMMKLADGNLSNGIAGLYDFNMLYTFLINIYSIKKGQWLDEDDYNKLYFGGLDERIIQALDRFDEVTEVPDPTVKLIKTIKNMVWQDSSTKTFLKKFEGLREYYMLSAHPGNFKFFRAENSVIRFLTVCSGTSRNKIFADKNDVIIAHKTYLKLIKTDLTRINPLKDPSIYKVNEWEDIFPNKKEKTNNKTGIGYLVCQKCNGYYKLEEGESPDDFTDKCECGGHLEYKENL